jgi:signal transduction histidine kinase
VELERFELRELIGATVERFAADARAKQLALHVRLADDLPREVFGEPDMISVLLGRLLDHALGSTESGEVVVTVRRELGNRFRIAVSDTGRGMTPEASLRFVTGMNGEVGVHTAPDLGSTVWFFARLETSEATAGA